MPALGGEEKEAAAADGRASGVESAARGAVPCRAAEEGRRRLRSARSAPPAWARTRVSHRAGAGAHGSVREAGGAGPAPQGRMDSGATPAGPH